ncbi:MAG: pitrilysin family protein [Armatimonadota bacterium]|nr:pitrilysin family protein [Armatimonadota bacterium]
MIRGGDSEIPTQRTVPIIVYYALILLCVSGAVFAAPFTTASVTSTTLDNGLKAIVLEDHSADLVAVEIWVKAGNIVETKENNGVSHFLEHVLFKGTEKRGPGQADKEIESLGSSLEASTSRDAIRISTIVASKYFDAALDVLTDVAMRAKLDPREIEREKLVILDEIARRDSDVLQSVAGVIDRAYFTNHPYGFPIEGSAANVKAITQQQIKDFYQTYFVPNNMAVIIVGDITAAKAVEAVKEAFKEFKKRDLPALQTPIAAPPTAIHKEKITNQTKLGYCAIGFFAPGIRDAAEVYAMDVLTQYLASGYQSWMQTSLKTDKGDAQVVASEFTTRRDPGNIILFFGTDPGNVEDTKLAVIAKLKQMKETPISDAEIATAKRSLEGGFAFDTETYAGRAHSLGFYESLGDYKLSLAYIENIRKVTPEDIRKVVAKYINTDAYITAEVGP